MNRGVKLCVRTQRVKGKIKTLEPGPTRYMNPRPRTGTAFVLRVKKIKIPGREAREQGHKSL